MEKQSSINVQSTLFAHRNAAVFSHNPSRSARIGGRSKSPAEFPGFDFRVSETWGATAELVKRIETKTAHPLHFEPLTRLSKAPARIQCKQLRNPLIQCSATETTYLNRVLIDPRSEPEHTPTFICMFSCFMETQASFL